ncbi:MAG: TonB-dependent receptor [Cyclobacteriaceae bacterium]|nr:TonB-dependent receptor [Cyclobacteriaceae bacterium]
MKSFYTIILLYLFFSPSFAQEVNDTTKISYLNEVVISANRWEQNLREVSSRITKVGAQQIQFQNPQTAADLLGLSNQVFIQKSQLGGGSPMIRGFSTNRVLLVVDGVRMNNAIFRSGNLQNVISLDANAIEETEVIFGPGSVIYGSDAIGGVMDFHTLNPRMSTDNKVKLTGNVFTRFSSANEERTGHLDFMVGLKKWAFTTSITKGFYGDLRMGSDGPIEYTRSNYQVRDGNGNDIAVINPDPNVQVSTGFDQLNVMQKIRFKANNNWSVSYGFHFSETSNVPRYDRLLLKTGNVFTSAEWYYGPQRWMMHALNVSFVKATALFDQAKLTAGYQEYEESRHNRNFTGGNRNRRTDRFEAVKAFSVNIDFDKQLNPRANLFYGVEYVSNQVGSTARRVNIVDGTVSGISTRYPNGSEWSSTAAYASLRYKLTAKWLLNASARYTYVYTYAPFDLTYFDFPFTEASLKNGAVNGSLGIIYNPTSNWKLYSNLSTGFRAPNVDDIGKVFDSTPGTVVVPNPNLEPEKAYNAELGVAGKIAEGLTIDVSAFYTLLNNSIVRGKYTFNGQSQIDYDGTLSDVYALQNSSELSVRGFQVGLLWDITKNFKLASNLNIQSGKEKDIATGMDYSPTHVAPTFGSIQLVYKTEALQLSAYMSYQGEISYENLALTERADAHLYAKDANGNPFAPSWNTFHIKAAYTINKIFTFDAGVENLFDKRYRPYSSGITAPGRNFFGTLRIKI